MKKIFAAIICLAIFINFSVAQAKIVRVADEGAEILYQNILKTLTTDGNNYLVGELQRIPSRDYQVENETLRAWRFSFGNYEEQFGNYEFLVNYEGYVATISIFIHNQAKITLKDESNLVGAMFFSIGLPIDDAITLIKNLQKNNTDGESSSIWSYEKNKYFILLKENWGSYRVYFLGADR